MKSSIRVVTAPAVEPISLAEAREFCRVDSDDTTQDSLLLALIMAAREYAENLTRRSFVQRTLELTLEEFCHEIVLDYPPLLYVESIKYIDLSGDLQTVDPTLYQVDTSREPGRVKPVYAEFWPNTRGCSDFNAVRVRYVAGYAPSGSPDSDADYRANLPEALRVWTRQKVAQMYTNREPTVIGAIVGEIKRDHFDGLLDGLVTGLYSW
jgi:uncharacterized phiE125 gp8 family phage protein